MRFDLLFNGNEHSRNSEAESTALKEVFDQYYLSLCFFAEKIVNDRPAAEDIVENTFIKLWLKEKDFTKHGNIKALLYISVRNACYDFIKTSRRNRLRQEQLAYLQGQGTEDFILNEITRAEVLREIYEALQKLPPECRKVMHLYFEEGWDHKRISSHLGLAVSTVKNHKSRGIQLLKKKLGYTLLLSFIIFLLS